MGSHCPHSWNSHWKVAFEYQLFISRGGAHLALLQNMAPKLSQQSSHGAVPMPTHLESGLYNCLPNTTQQKWHYANFQAQDLRNWQLPFPIFWDTLRGNTREEITATTTCQSYEWAILKVPNPWRNNICIYAPMLSAAEIKSPTKPCPNCRFGSKIKDYKTTMFWG